MNGYMKAKKPRERIKAYLDVLANFSSKRYKRGVYPANLQAWHLTLMTFYFDLTMIYLNAGEVGEKKQEEIDKIYKIMSNEELQFLNWLSKLTTDKYPPLTDELFGMYKHCESILREISERLIKKEEKEGIIL